MTVYAGCDLSSIYDFNYYESNNPDIKAKYGNNDMGALEHFVVFGLSENRQGKSSYSSTDYQAAKYHFEALRVLNRIGHSLRAAFNYSCMKYVRNNSLTNPSYGTHYYAHIGLTQHKGNCYVMAATFCELAKALGYNAVQVSGVVPLRSGGLGPHSWVELGGYVYDPDFQVESGKSGYKIYYGKPGTWRYYKQQYMSA